MCSLLPHPSQGLEEAKTLGTGQGAGPVQPSAEKEQSLHSGRRADLPLSRSGDTGPPRAGLPPGKVLAPGQGSRHALPTNPQRSGSVLSHKRGGMIPVPRLHFPFPSFTSPHPSCVVPVQAAVKTNHWQDSK